MRKKRLILYVGLFLIGFLVILLPTFLIIMDSEETKEYNNDTYVPFGIIEQVYQFEPYNQYNIYGDFTPPYLDQWSIFICHHNPGFNDFIYHDKIIQLC